MFLVFMLNSFLQALTACGVCVCTQTIVFPRVLGTRAPLVVCQPFHVLAACTPHFLGKGQLWFRRVCTLGYLFHLQANTNIWCFLPSYPREISAVATARASSFASPSVTARGRLVTPDSANVPLFPRNACSSPIAFARGRPRHVSGDPILNSRYAAHLSCGDPILEKNLCVPHSWGARSSETQFSIDKMPQISVF